MFSLFVLIIKKTLIKLLLLILSTVKLSLIEFYEFVAPVAKHDIYVLPSDKSGPVAVMRATRYHALGLDVLQDADTFTQVDEDDEEAIDVKVMQSSHNRQIRAILDRLGGDQDELYRRLESPYNPQHPTMTAYPKVHKLPVKARPVISHRNTPISRSCKWTADILSPYVGRISTAHIRDTRDFHTRVSRCQARGAFWRVSNREEN